MVDIPPDTAITLEAQFPTDQPDWPGPPAWTTSTPDTSVLALIDGSDQKRATATASANLTVTVASGSLNGTVDLNIVPEAAVPTDPVPVTLA